jgi:ABC-2 type transport system ATP-binding protein
MPNLEEYNMQLTATDVTKVIKGKTVLSHINLSLNSGYVYGFVGPNASGKTMLFRVLSGLISATTGIVSLNGKILKKAFPVLPDLGILLENVSLYPELTGYENLDYLAKFNHKIDKAGIIEALQRVGLDPADKRKYGKYSLGMKQRLAIAQAVMERPGILMLDEPTNALDQDSVKVIRGLIKSEKDRGAIVLLASHNKEDIQLLCDHTFTMDGGAIVGR